MMTSKLQTMKERLTEAAGDLLDAGLGSHITREQVERMNADRRREAQQLAHLRAEQEKGRLQRLQYEQTNRAFLDELLSDNATIKAMDAEIAEKQSALDLLYKEYQGTCQRIDKIQSSGVVDLSSADVSNLVDTAIKRRKAARDEAEGLASVKLELERRIALAEEAIGELRSAWLKAKRTALHLYIDGKMIEVRPVLERTLSLLKEIRRSEDMVRGLGGVRQAFLSNSFVERIDHVVNRWDKELDEIKRFSEKYD